MRLSVHLQITLKDFPDDYQGVTSESWNFGKERGCSMGEMVYSIYLALSELYGGFTSSDVMNFEHQLLKSVLEDMVWKEKKP